MQTSNMFAKTYTCVISFMLCLTAGAETTAKTPKKILFFTKSSGYEHDVISWKKGQPSFAEKILLDLGKQNNWSFVFSKNGSLFSEGYLKQFDAVLLYTTGNLLEAGTDKNPPMTPTGKDALLAYVRNGGALLGTHSASDTFHTNNESLKGPDRYLNHCEQADPFVRCLGGEFIIHGEQQKATVINTDRKFPGYELLEDRYELHEEWYSLKDFAGDLHVLGVIQSPQMHGTMYQRPPYPVTWARYEGKGRVWYSAMGHREDVWTNQIFQQILCGGLRWAMQEQDYPLTPNLKQVAPDAHVNPSYVAPKK